MKKLILKFSSGKDANKEYSFDAVPSLSVSIGRDPACQVVVHEQEDVVSRCHAVIQAADPARSDDWIIVDNSSANGLLINEVEVKQRHPINDDDVIRLGRSGPTLRVGFDPKPLKATRVVSEVPPAKATRLETPAKATRLETPTEPVTPTAAPGGVGKETLERRIGEVTTHLEKDSKKKLMTFGAVALGLLVAIGGFSYFRAEQQAAAAAAAAAETRQQAAATAARQQAAVDSVLNKPVVYDPGLATKIRTDWGNSTVLIEAQWQIVEAVSGRPVYHKVKKYQKETFPLYREMPDGAIRPVITFDVTEGEKMFGGTHTGTGFVVSADGFIMTNKHVAEGWTVPFQFKFPGLVQKKDNGGIDRIEALPATQIDWEPIRDGYFLEDKGSSEKRFEGRNMSIAVVFPNGSVRVPARNGSSSTRHDVALLKIDAAKPLTPVVLNSEARTSVQPGSKVVQLGYPGISSSTYLTMRSQQGKSETYNRTTVQDVSVNEGLVSKLVPPIQSSTSGTLVVSKLGDYIEMNIHHGGPGNSGGPIFDAQGKVIALFTADVSNRNGSGSIALGVPISYGLELLDPTHKVIK